jgi:uncharacterized protein YdcH (DUF465 family)
MANAELPLEEHVRAELLQQDEAFRQLVTEHHALDEQVHQLASLPHLTDDEHYTEIALKKRKLALKDRIEAIVRGQVAPLSPARSQ